MLGGKCASPTVTILSWIRVVVVVTHKGLLKILRCLRQCGSCNAFKAEFHINTGLQYLIQQALTFFGPFFGLFFMQTYAAPPNHCQLSSALSALNDVG